MDNYVLRGIPESQFLSKSFEIQFKKSNFEIDESLIWVLKINSRLLFEEVHFVFKYLERGK